MGKVLCIQIAQTEQERKPCKKLGEKVMISSNKILYAPVVVKMTCSYALFECQARGGHIRMS